MDYTVFLASVAADSIERCRATGDTELTTSRLASCPHDLVNLDLQPLGEVLAELVDVGQPLRNDGWHPLRAPVVVDPETVMARSRRLDDAWQLAAPELGGLLGEVVGDDVTSVRDLYAHASARNEWVVSYLSAPADADQAARALIPTTDPTAVDRSTT